MDRVEKLLEFLNASPNDNFLRHALAMEYLKAGKEKEAQQLLEAVLKDCPEYVGSYYQLAKLLEKNGETEKAVFWYERGMEYAKKANERHTYNELQSALDELIY
ncbi:MAG TPA: tetratricopeptide repeat protein [Arachidicoccus soli]|uniref:Uncharacterized protein n=1 Tax=Arachidicoccus soli TaxID=2341117 RepID=A0A386HRL7_9BACT|nr:tetratricopeptide repeat protein [Arachidicoccus soli]AYD48598.1 hypothetical protein D6B99_13895 [Arachidicoccus soli]HEU0228298.1 tetratricopeptide repeat protein [Arachidicoccus soli]